MAKPKMRQRGHEGVKATILAFAALREYVPRSLEGGLVHSGRRRSPRPSHREPSWIPDLPPAPTPPFALRKRINMALYEHVIIARQDISPQQAEALNDQLKHLLEEQGGHVAKIEYWGLRNLTYRIKKNRKGHYSLLAIDAPSAAVKEMERQLSINEDVLRFMTVRVEELDLELSPVLARRDRDRERDSARRGYDDMPA
jgi:small subunit ribosomal protein S6